MTTGDILVQRILTSVPEFGLNLDTLKADFYPDDPGLCLTLGSLVWWVSEQVAAGRTAFGALRDVLEEALVHGEAEVRDAVATCFVESLVNRVPEQIPRHLADSLLGPVGQEVAKDWLNF